LDRFLKQIFSDVENLVIQEYRFYRYLFLTTLKCLLILFFVPFFVNFLAKTYVVRPLTEYFWNTKQTEIFLNSYQQKRAFSELKEFEEKTYFESLIFPKSVFKPNLYLSPLSSSNDSSLFDSGAFFQPFSGLLSSGASQPEGKELLLRSDTSTETKEQPADNRNGNGNMKSVNTTSTETGEVAVDKQKRVKDKEVEQTMVTSLIKNPMYKEYQVLNSSSLLPSVNIQNIENSPLYVNKSQEEAFSGNKEGRFASYTPKREEGEKEEQRVSTKVLKREKIDDFKQTESLINSYTMKSSLFVYQTREADKNIQQRYQEKTIELAQRYNYQSIEAITNFFADLISLFTLFYLLYVLEIQINITKSFLLEVFFGLDDSKKSLLILLITDLLVGYHSSNLWELFFEFLFHHYGLPESQTGIFLLVATLPVLLDVLFKYLIFRHLNRSSPATVATYHAMIE
jgi:hypothetical protein